MAMANAPALAPAPPITDNPRQRPAAVREPPTQEMPLRLIGLAMALPSSSYFSNYEVYIAERRLRKNLTELVKLVYVYLPYQRRLSEYGVDNSKVYKLGQPGPTCDESLMQMTWPETDPHPDAHNAADAPGLSAADKKGTLPLLPHHRRRLPRSDRTPLNPTVKGRLKAHYRRLCEAVNAACCPRSLPLNERAPKTVCMLGLVLVCLGKLSLAQDKVFDWVRASGEVSQLDPADYHAGRIYRPGSDGGSMHVDIQAKRPVTIAMAFASDWNDWQQHAESEAPEFRCMREHVTSTTYECHMPPNRPMVLLIRDERTSDRAVFKGIGVVLGRGARQFISPNEVTVTYYSWTCVQNCIQPEFQWFSLVKEKYELTSVPKIYSLLTERDGQQVNVRIKHRSP
jgi:hypothetical protein